jgi:hypothetical protein
MKREMQEERIREETKEMGEVTVKSERASRRTDGGRKESD